MHCAGFAIANSFQEPEDYSNYDCAIAFLSRESCSVQSSEELQQRHVVHHKGHVAEHVGAPGVFRHAFPPPFNFIGPGDVGLELVSDQLAEAEVSTGNGTYNFRIVPSPSHPLGLIIDARGLPLKWGTGTANFFE